MQTTMWGVYYSAIVGKHLAVREDYVKKLVKN